MGCSSAYGGSPLASSMAVMPKLQMSALWSYPDCLMTSGLIQYGVPTNVFFFADSVPLSWPETPKSASLTATWPWSQHVVSPTKPGERGETHHHRLRSGGYWQLGIGSQVKPRNRARIDGRLWRLNVPLISRCSFPSEWRYSSPLRSSRTTIEIYSSRKTPGFIYERVRHE